MCLLIFSSGSHIGTNQPLNDWKVHTYLCTPIPGGFSLTKMEGKWCNWISWMHPVLPKSTLLPVVQPPEEDSEEPHQLRSFGCLGTAVLPHMNIRNSSPQNSVQLNTRPMILVYFSFDVQNFCKTPNLWPEKCFCCTLFPTKISVAIPDFQGKLGKLQAAMDLIWPSSLNPWFFYEILPSTCTVQQDWFTNSLNRGTNSKRLSTNKISHGERILQWIPVKKQKGWMP